MKKAFQTCNDTWNKSDGILMVDYSDQELGYRKGKHCMTIDLHDFSNFILQTQVFDYDLMLEIKDKQISALKALDTLNRLNTVKAT